MRTWRWRMVSTTQNITFGTGNANCHTDQPFEKKWSCKYYIFYTLHVEQVGCLYLTALYRCRLSSLKRVWIIEWSSSPSPDWSLASVGLISHTHIPPTITQYRAFNPCILKCIDTKLLQGSYCYNEIDFNFLKPNVLMLLVQGCTVGGLVHLINVYSEVTAVCVWRICFWTPQDLVGAIKIVCVYFGYRYALVSPALNFSNKKHCRISCSSARASV